MIADGDREGAYAAQTINTARALQAGRRLVGRKIGLTSLAVQKQLGVHQPDYGMLFADMARGDGEEISLRDVMQAKVEAEIAFVIGRDLAEDQLTIADLHRAIEYALPAIEIVGSRIKNWDIKITDTIADNASSGLYVLGSRPCPLDSFDPRLAGMVMEKRGEPVSVGAGAACMGNPLNARTLAREGHGPRGKPPQSRRHDPFRRAGPHGGGCARRRFRRSNQRPRLRPGRILEGISEWPKSNARSSARAISAPT